MITEEFINSVEYTKFMFKDIDENSDMMNLAQKSMSFWNRYTQFQYGSWRWFSAYQHRDIIAKYVFSDMKGIDFGGGRGPIFGNAEIVDILEIDSEGREIKYHNLNKFKSDILDYVFSSHTLEHVEDLRHELNELHRVLKENGKLILLLPSHTCYRWNVGGGNTHERNLYLSTDKHADYMKDFVDFVEIDTYIRVSGFNIIEVENCWDNNIFILAEKGEKFWADWMTLGLR